MWIKVRRSENGEGCDEMWDEREMREREWRGTREGVGEGDKKREKKRKHKDKR